MEIELKTLEDTEKLAQIIASAVNKKCLIKLNGTLSAGKTTFTKFLAKYLGVKETVSSPTFNILKEYNSKKGIFYHIDAYRLEHSEEELSFEDIFYEDGIIVVEWGEFIYDFLPNECLNIDIKIFGNTRTVFISSVGAMYGDLLKEIKNKW